jgi:hypothetical protein
MRTSDLLTWIKVALAPWILSVQLGGAMNKSMAKKALKLRPACYGKLASRCSTFSE